MTKLAGKMALVTGGSRGIGAMARIARDYDYTLAELRKL